MKTKPKKGIHHASRGTLSNPRSKNDSKRNRKKKCSKINFKKYSALTELKSGKKPIKKKKEIEKIMLDLLLEFFFFLENGI
jgi:hypothetical protein